jgi:hypothetical protein
MRAWETSMGSFLATESSAFDQRIVEVTVPLVPIALSGSEGRRLASLSSGHWNSVTKIRDKVKRCEPFLQPWKDEGSIDENHPDSHFLPLTSFFVPATFANKKSGEFTFIRLFTRPFNIQISYCFHEIVCLLIKKKMKVRMTHSCARKYM